MVIVAVLYGLLPQLASWGATGKLIVDANHALFAIAVLCEIFALIGYANLFRYILMVLDIRIRLSEVLRVTLAGLAVSHVLSAGGAGGWVVSYNALRRKNVPHGLVFVAVAALNFFNYAVLWLLFVVAMCYLVISGQRSSWEYILALLVIFLILWLTGYAIYLFNHRAKMRRRVASVAGIVNRIARRAVIRPDHIDDWLDHLFVGMRRMRSHRGLIRKTLGSACPFWFFDLLCLYFVFLAFRYPISPEYLVIGYAIAYAVGTLSPTPGGLGAIEGIMIAMFASFGVPIATATAVVLSYRLVNFWMPVPPGLIASFSLRRGQTDVDTPAAV